MHKNDTGIDCLGHTHTQKYIEPCCKKHLMKRIAFNPIPVSAKKNTRYDVPTSMSFPECFPCVPFFILCCQTAFIPFGEGYILFGPDHILCSILCSTAGGIIVALYVALCEKNLAIVRFGAGERTHARSPRTLL